VPLCPHKPHMLCLDMKLGRRGGKPVTNRLSYGTAHVKFTVCGCWSHPNCSNGIWNTIFSCRCNSNAVKLCHLLTHEIVKIYSSSIIGLLDIIHHSVFYLKQVFADSTLPLSSGKKSTQFGPINGANPHPWAQLTMEAGSSLWNVLNKKTGRWKCPKSQ
jgi:hypothetical protein